MNIKMQYPLKIRPCELPFQDGVIKSLMKTFMMAIDSSSKSNWNEMEAAFI